MAHYRTALLAALATATFVPAAFAQFNIGAPTTDWVAVPYGPTLLGDPFTDHQTGQGEADIVGSTGTLATSLPSFYSKYVAGTTVTNGTMYFRIRVGGDQSPAGFKSVALIGLDANRDGKLDLFLGVDNSGQSNGIYMWKPGTGLNISPSTTSMVSKSPLKKYTQTATNYHWGAVTSNSTTASVVLDPTANTADRQDFNKATGTDFLLSFSVPMQDLVASLSVQGVAFDSNTPATFVMGTATQANSFNQDLNGTNGNTSSSLTWGALGVLTQPINSSGVVVNVAPVNTVSGPRTANRSLAVTGVSVNDPDGNLATVRITATNGTVTMNLAGGASVVTGALNSATVTIGGTQAQVNTALATLGYLPTSGYTGPASVTVLSTDTGGLTDSDSVAITVVSQANTAPVANADSASTHSGKPAAVYVIGNDVDADGNVLTITSANLTSGTGTVSFVNGIITYTPPANFAGTAVIGYAINDGLGGTASSTLTVSVSANAAPDATNDTLNANNNTTIFINVLANDSDADGDPLAITGATRTSGNGTVTNLGNELQFDSPNTNGTTVLTYTISDGFGGNDTATVTITTGSNTAPIAESDTASATEGTPVDINVLANDSDANGDPLTISDAVVTSGSGTAIAVNGKLRFTPALGFLGVATIQYTIDDGRGGTATAQVTVTVTGNSAPTATADSYTVAEDGALTTAAPGILANDTDPNANMLTAVLVSNVSQGTLVLNPDGSFNYTPTTNYNGPDSFTYRASDGSLTSTVVTVSINVTAVNDAPLANPNDYTVAEDATLTINAPGILANDSDIEGTSLSAVLAGNVSHGTLSLNADGSFNYTPTPNYSGPDSFTYRASDGTLASNVVTVSLTVTPAPDAPVATADSYTVAEDQVLTVNAPGILDNDSDADLSALSAVLVADAAHGTLSLNANGSFNYTPTPNYSGPDSFTYRASDGTLQSGIVTVNVTVTPVADVPVATADSYIVAEDDTLIIIAPGVLDNDADADQEGLTAALVTDVAHGTLHLNAVGSFTYTPTANYHGADSFTYRASDGTSDSNVVTVSITVTPRNDTPTATADDYSVQSGATLDAPAPGVLANDSDLDGEPLSAALVTGVSHGTLTLNDDGSFTYTPTAGYVGDDTFVYQASDGTATSAPVTVTIHIAPGNIAPNAVPDNFSIAQGATLSVAAPGILGNDTDTDPLNATLVGNVSHGTLTLNANGSFTYTPSTSYSGPDSFTYRAGDGTLQSGITTVSITVTGPANRPPSLTGPSTLNTSVSTSVPFTIGTSDPDGDTVTVTFNGPAHGTITGSGPSYNYVPSPVYTGTDTFSIVASDGRGGMAIRVVKVNVTADAATVGNYALFLRDDEGAIAGHVVLTSTKYGRATGVATIGGVRYTIRGFFGGPPSTIYPRSKGFAPIMLQLSIDQSVPGQPELVVSITDAASTYTGRTVRSPYTRTNPAPQAGRYTIIASRQQLVLDRTGARLDVIDNALPPVACALTARVSATGAVVFSGYAGHNRPLTCSSYVMNDSLVPFYAGRLNPGASILHSMLQFPVDPVVVGNNGVPAVTGSLIWDATLDLRIPTPFVADYAVLGARYTPAPLGRDLLQSPSLTIRLDVPSYRSETPWEETRTFSGNILPHATGTGNVSAVRLTLSSGLYIGRVMGATTRPFFGVIIQGEDIDRGLGSLVDFTSLGTSELLPAVQR